MRAGIRERTCRIHQNLGGGTHCCNGGSCRHPRRRLRFIIFRVTAPQMTTLYNELTLEDSASIVSQLESQGVQFEIARQGASILVPNEQVARLRMQLAAEGLPTGGSIGYEIFDRSDTLGATSFVQNINHLRAMEGELSRTIGSLDRIRAARVHLVIPERQLFQRDRRPPSASIVLNVRGALGPGEIRAVQHLLPPRLTDLSRTASRLSTKAAVCWLPARATTKTA